MKKSTVILLLSASILAAQNLKELYREVERSPLFQSRVEAIDAESARAASQRYEDGWSVGADLARAFPKEGGSSGTEYALSVGKEFNLRRSVLGRLLKQNRIYHELRKRVELNRLKSRLFGLYGSYCIDAEALAAQKHLAAIYREMLKQIDTGVRFGEFDASKALMAHLALENLNLKIVETESRMKWIEGEISGIVPFDSRAECPVTEPGLRDLLDPENSAYAPLLGLRETLSKEALTLSRSRVPKIGLSATYSDEIDTRRATLGLSVPLSFGKRSEAERVAALHDYSAAKREKEALERSYRAASEALRKRLGLYTSKVERFEASINLTTETLIEQSRMRFKAGEESFLSLLKAAETKLQMIETLLTLKTKRHEAIIQFIDAYAVDPEGANR
ncbi:TolC family protein [Hydrogenimonas sp.]